MNLKTEMSAVIRGTWWKVQPVLETNRADKSIPLTASRTPSV
jgi:hypothetical protein